MLSVTSMSVLPHIYMVCATSMSRNINIYMLCVDSTSWDLKNIDILKGFALFCPRDSGRWSPYWETVTMGELS